MGLPADNPPPANLGDVLFDGQNVNYVDPPKRNVAMVFENYALYPHITVYKSIAFPLRGPLYKGKITEAEIDARVHKVATIMNIDHLLERMPAHLSNGQRQRAALGRALVREPNVFLLDEPLAHLDAKLRNLMRTELKALQKDLYTTTIYVTHDFMEAPIWWRASFTPPSPWATGPFSSCKWASAFCGVSLQTTSILG